MEQDKEVYHTYVISLIIVLSLGGCAMHHSRSYQVDAKAHEQENETVLHVPAPAPTPTPETQVIPTPVAMLFQPAIPEVRAGESDQNVEEMEISHSGMTNPELENPAEEESEPKQIPSEADETINIHAELVPTVSVGRFLSEEKPIAGVNPSELAVFERLESDLARAIAWQESKWKQFRKDGSVIKGTHGGTGIMQMVSRAWSKWFRSHGNKPGGYKIASWEEIQNNWQTNVDNGKYLIEVYIPSLMTRAQKNWPPTAESLHTPNQQDLIIYGYQAQARMKKVTKANWDRTVARSSYVKRIRKVLSEKPWEKEIARSIDASSEGKITRSK
jgi:hypothetical protein